MSASRQDIVLGSVLFEIYAQPNSTSSNSRENRVPVSTWLRFHGIPVMEDQEPSLATISVFHVSRREPGVNVSLNLLSSDPPVLSARLSVSFRPSTESRRCLSPGSKALRDVLAHIFEQVAEESVIARPRRPLSNSGGDISTEANGGNTTLGNDAKSVAACGFLKCGGCIATSPQARGRFHLDRVFDECAGDDPNDSFVDENHSLNVVHASIAPNDQISRLPTEIVKRIISFLSAAHVTALGNTCRTFQAATRHFVPGLLLTLYPHQCIGLDRMQKMEHRVSESFPMPMLRVLPVSLGNGRLLVADMCTGSLFDLDRMPLASAPRGGLICDEPGLGKTITGISLILKTLGQRASPPLGLAQTSLTQMHKGKEVAFPVYMHRTFGRYVAAAEAPVRTPPRHDRILKPGVLAGGSADRRSARVITPTKFYQLSKGRGSLPTAAGADETTYLSTATLVLAPPQIVRHWEMQVKLHTAPAALRTLVIRSANHVPSPAVLAHDFDVIIMSFRVVNGLYKKMRSSTPSIFRVRFLRVIMDEGHKLGSSRMSLDQFPRVCAAVKAERRWIMTGTPTPSTPSSDVHYLHPLLQFIGEQTYGLDPKSWSLGIEKPYEAFRPESLDRLKDLMRRVMIRTSKKMIKSIPKVHMKSVFLSFTTDSATSYNDLVMVVARNLLTSDWFRDDHEESLLNPKNAKERNLVLNNLRRSCCFGGIMRSKVEIPDLVECLDKLYSFSRTRNHGTLTHIRAKDRIMEVFSHLSGDKIEKPPKNAPQLLLSQHNMPVIAVPSVEPVFIGEEGPRTLEPPVSIRDKEYSDLRLRMHYRGRLAYIAKCLIDGGKCENCDVETRLPFATPCCHVVCNQCMINCRTRCPVKSCGTLYTVDRAGVPEELIELQPAMLSMEWQPTWDRTKSSKMDYLLGKLHEIPQTSHIVNNVPTSYRKKVIVFSQFTEHLMLTAIELKRDPELRNAYVELYTNERDISTGRRKNLDLYLDRQLEKFRNDPNIFILLMGQSRGSVGLDLSFVEHIFLLEPFLDASLEKQVVSRAHRMGAKAPVFVERLVMRESVEADLLQFSDVARKRPGAQGDVSRDIIPDRTGVGKVKTEQENQKRKSLLLRLNYVRSAEEIQAAQEGVGVGGMRASPERTAHPMQEGYQSRQSARKTGDSSARKRRASWPLKTPEGKKRAPFGVS